MNIIVLDISIIVTQVKFLVFFQPFYTLLKLYFKLAKDSGGLYTDSLRVLTNIFPREVEMVLHWTILRCKLQRMLSSPWYWTGTVIAEITFAFLKIRLCGCVCLCLCARS